MEETKEIVFEEGMFNFAGKKRSIHATFSPHLFRQGGKENAAVISLPADLHSDLDWSVQKQEAAQVIEKGGLLVWKFDFGLDRELFCYTDSMAFQSFTIAIDLFTKTLLAEFKEHTLGVILYQGDTEFFSRISWDGQLQSNLEEWLGQIGKKALSLEELYQTEEGNLLLSRYSASVFSEYLHRLLSYFPDTILAFCLFSLSPNTSFARAVHILSKERFPHVHLGLQGSVYPFANLVWDEESMCSLPQKATFLGVCMPLDEECSLSSLSDLEEVFNHLQKENIPFRILFESSVHEEWGELEKIIVASSSVSSHGKRKLQGFCAAGGTVVTRGEVLDLMEEISWEDFKKKSE